jgi:hypothetical protein
VAEIGTALHHLYAELRPLRILGKMIPVRGSKPVREPVPSWLIGTTPRFASLNDSMIPAGVTAPESSRIAQQCLEQLLYGIEMGEVTSKG